MLKSNIIGFEKSDFFCEILLDPFNRWTRGEIDWKNITNLRRTIEEIRNTIEIRKVFEIGDATT